MKNLASVVLSVTLLSCASMPSVNEHGQPYTVLPNERGIAVCVEGDCENGYGKMRAPDQLEIEGRWKDGAVVDGYYQVSFDGKTVKTYYDRDVPSEGLLVFGYEHDRDYFIGQLTRIKYPFRDLDVNYPSKGIYHHKNGAEFEGTFIFLPSMGGPEGNYNSNRYIFRKHPDTTGVSYLDNRFYQVHLLGNLVFIGEIRYKGQSEYGVYAHENYRIGTKIKLVEVKDGDILTSFQQQYQDDLNYLAELKLREREREKESAWDINWGMVAALGAGVAMADSSSLSGNAKAEFLTAYSKDIISGSTDNLTNLRSKYHGSKTTDEIFAESREQINRIAEMKKREQAEYKQHQAIQEQSNNPSSAKTAAIKYNAPSTGVSSSSNRANTAHQQPTKKSVAGTTYVKMNNQWQKIDSQNRSSAQDSQTNSQSYQGGHGTNNRPSQQQVASESQSSSATTSKPQKPNKPQCMPEDEHGVRIPAAGIPKNKWCYIYTLQRPLSWTDTDINNSPLGLFGYESGSPEGARNQVELSMATKAKEICKAEGYDGIYDNDYRFGELIHWSEVDCEEKVRLGSTFYFCRGDATYRCGAKRQK